VRNNLWVIKIFFILSLHYRVCLMQLGKDKHSCSLSPISVSQHVSSPDMILYRKKYDCFFNLNLR